MHSLAFDPAMVNLIKAGAMRFHLYPPLPKLPALGADVPLTALRGGKAPKLVATPACIVRARLVLVPTGVLRVLDLRHQPEAAGLANLVEGAQQGDARAPTALPRLAAFGGFADWPALYAFHLKTEQGAGRRTPRGRIVRELIGWGAVR